MREEVVRLVRAPRPSRRSLSVFALPSLFYFTLRFFISKFIPPIDSVCLLGLFFRALDATFLCLDSVSPSPILARSAPPEVRRCCSDPAKRRLNDLLSLLSYSTNCVKYQSLVPRVFEVSPRIFKLKLFSFNNRPGSVSSSRLFKFRSPF